MHSFSREPGGLTQQLHDQGRSSDPAFVPLSSDEFMHRPDEPRPAHKETQKPIGLAGTGVGPGGVVGPVSAQHRGIAVTACRSAIWTNEPSIDAQRDQHFDAGGFNWMYECIIPGTNQGVADPPDAGGLRQWSNRLKPAAANSPVPVVHGSQDANKDHKTQWEMTSITSMQALATDQVPGSGTGSLCYGCWRLPRHRAILPGRRRVGDRSRQLNLHAVSLMNTDPPQACAEYHQ